MLLKIVIIVFLIGIFYALGSGLYYLLKEGTGSKQLVKALFWRLILSLILFGLLLFAFAMHWITPHGLGQ